DELHVELRDRHLGARVAVERDELVQRPITDHDSGRVGGGVSVEPLELQCDVDQPRHAFVLAAHRLELRLSVDRLLQAYRIGGIVRHELADTVHLTVRHAENASYVPQDGTGLKLSESYDLGDAVVPVLL